MSGKRYPGELKIEAVKQVVDRDLPPELTPGMILATSALGCGFNRSILHLQHPPLCNQRLDVASTG